MTDHFGIGLAGENPALRDQLIPQRLEILDDAIVDQRHVADDMGMRVVLGWCAMSGPAGMGNADRAGPRLPHQLSRQIVEFPPRPAAAQPAVMHGADNRRTSPTNSHPQNPIPHPIPPTHLYPKTQKT